VSAAEEWRDAFTGGESCAPSGGREVLAKPPRTGSTLTLLPPPRSSVPGGAQLHLVKSAPHLLMYAESGVANRMVIQFLTTALQLEPLADRRPSFT